MNFKSSKFKSTNFKSSNFELSNFKEKNYKTIVIVLAVLMLVWIGFIFYMSSQNAEASGNMSSTITKSVLQAGENAGIFSEDTATSGKKVVQLHQLIRNLAHIGMYFLLSCFVLITLWTTGMKGLRWGLISFLFCLLVSIADEFNQMRYTGRNDNGLIRSGLDDVYRDAVGVLVAIAFIYGLRAILSMYNQRKFF